MSTNYQDRTIALAGILQSACLVNQVATKGMTEELSYRATIQSMFYRDSPNVANIYGGVSGVRLGLEELISIFGNNKKPHHGNIARYMFSCIFLEGKLRRNPSLLTKLTSVIKQAEKHLPRKNPNDETDLIEDFDEDLLALLAQGYVDTVGTFKHRIQVFGHQTFLENSAQVNKIRALLLAGIRSAVLWQQVGGSRLSLIFSRKRILNQSKQLLETLNS